MKHQTMLVSGFKLYFEFILSHPPGRTAGSLMYVYNNSKYA